MRTFCLLEARSVFVFLYLHVVQLDSDIPVDEETCSPLNIVSTENVQQ